jgi:hypothetical protein
MPNKNPVETGGKLIVLLLNPEIGSSETSESSPTTGCYNQENSSLHQTFILIKFQVF